MADSPTFPIGDPAAASDSEIDYWISPDEQRFLQKLRGRDQSICMRIGSKLYEEAANHAPETVDALATVMSTFEEFVMADDPRDNERCEWVADGFDGEMRRAATSRHHLRLFDGNGKPLPGTELAKAGLAESEDDQDDIWPSDEAAR